MPTFVPPAEAFEFTPKPAIERTGTYDIPDLTSLTKTPAGEMATVYRGHPLPRKGLTYTEGLLANNQVKRITLSLFAPFASLKKGWIPFVESYLENYCNLADSIYFQCHRIPYLKKDLYAKNCQALWDITKVFLTEIGVTEDVADRTGKVIATLLQYDDAYRLPLVDALSEIDRNDAIKAPRKALSKVIAVMGERTANRLLVAKFNSFKTLLNLLLWLPKYKKALQKALEAVKFEDLQYDQFDFYWTLSKNDYDYQGRGWQERADEQLSYMAEHIIKINGADGVKFEKVSDTEVKIIPIKYDNP